MRTWIERAPVDRYFGNVLDWVKARQREGWTLTILIAPGGREVVILGFFHGLGRGRCGGDVGGSIEANQGEALGTKP